MAIGEAAFRPGARIQHLFSAVERGERRLEVREKIRRPDFTEEQKASIFGEVEQEDKDQVQQPEFRQRPVVFEEEYHRDEPPFPPGPKEGPGAKKFNQQ